MFKKIAKSILLSLLVMCSFTFISCDKKENKGGSEGSFDGKSVTSIELLTDIKDEYFVGDTLDITEATIKVTYTNHTTEDIIITNEMVSGFDTTTAGEKNITITFGEKTITVPYTVTDVVATNISIKTPFKTNYYVGDNLDLSNGKVTITYNNSTTKDVTITNSHIVNFSTENVGNFNLNVTVEGKTLTIPYTITALEVSSIAIKTPFKTSYFVGDNLDLSNAKLTATYNSGKTEDINILATMISGFDSTNPANINLTLTYSGKTITNISCQIKAIELVNVTLKESFKDTVYFVGETINLSGNKLILSYNNSTTKEIDISSSMILNFSTAYSGNKQFIIIYDNFSIIVNYTVLDVIATSIELVSNFESTTYFVGDKINLSGAQIKITYNNETTEILPVELNMIRNFSTSTAGTKNLTITYKEVSLTSEYTVSEIVALELTLSKPFNKTTYYTGQQLDVSGAEITINYSNGKSETLEVTNSMVKTFSTALGGENKKMKITYNGLSVYTNYTVIERLISVHTSIQNTYSINEELNVEGGQLIITYNNGTPTEYIDITAEMITGFDSTTAGTKYLTITYDGTKLTNAISYIVE